MNWRLILLANEVKSHLGPIWIFYFFIFMFRTLVDMLQSHFQVRLDPYGGVLTDMN